ncbi:MAG TPA: FAD-dependent tricarballylate dehydrogenase TcuA [Candidatus Dormibacteraeota bacterium]|nr:FAD-dependent tricarballylate dehydrogenase TcuA [Candidatus Dormibacteraeota bacterium]
MTSFDVVVAGGGNAALCAAIEARRAGASVLLLERTARESRGGNSKYTRNVRCAGDAYPEDEFLADLQAVTGDELDRDLASLAIECSRDVPGWLATQGVRWQPAFRGTLQLDRTNRFFLGGGKALVNAEYERARRLGVEVRYEADVVELEIRDGRCDAVIVRCAGERRAVRPRAVVVASGGYEANLDWLAEHWGEGARTYIVRGSRWNDGSLLRHLLDAGAEARGNPRGFHAIAVDARSPRFDGGIVTRVDSVPFGIVVNRDGARFADEGEDLWPKRYATWGRLIALQPGQVAHSIFDARAAGRFIPPVHPPQTAPTVEELARKLGLDPARLARTVAEYNRAIGPCEHDPTRLDDCRTEGLDPPKSHWALPVDQPPFAGYPLRPGVTFTYLGVAVDRQARVAPFENIYAAGEVMAGNVLRQGYLAGFGMTIGTVFGRLAGAAAARSSRR